VAPLARVGRIVGHGETVAIDLSLGEDEIWRQTRHNHRRQIRQAQRHGHIARIDQEWRQLDTFVQLYHDTMRRLGADDFYYFPRRFFSEMRQALGHRLHLCVVEIDGRVAAAGLFTEVCGIVQYHLSGTLDEMLENHPLKTMLNFVCFWAKDRGNRVFHLGGGSAAARIRSSASRPGSRTGGIPSLRGESSSMNGPMNGWLSSSRPAPR
jgi:hypothetical protein